MDGAKAGETGINKYVPWACQKLHTLGLQWVGGQRGGIRYNRKWKVTWERDNEMH